MPIRHSTWTGTGNKERRLFAERGTWEFANTYLSQYMTSPSCQFHRDLCLELDKALEPRGLLAGQAPRGHAKTQMSMAAILLSICTGRKKFCIIIGANKDEKARERLAEIVFELENNEALRADYGSAILPKKENRHDGKSNTMMWKDEAIVLANGGQITAMGFGPGGQIRGRKSIVGKHRPDLIVLDDPESDRNMTEVYREKDMHWVNAALIGGTDPLNCSIIWLGTKLHHEAALVKKMEDPAWASFDVFAITDASGNPSMGEPCAHCHGTGKDRTCEECDGTGLDKKYKLLWPQRYTYQILVSDTRSEMKKMGRALFWQEYLGTPISPEEQVFKPENWRRYPREWIYEDHGRMMLAEGRAAPRWLDVRMSVDSAFTEGAQSDYTAIFVGARDPQTNRIFILEIIRAKTNISALHELIREVYVRWRCTVAAIEANLAQATIAEQAQRRGLFVKEVKNRVHKERRISLAARFPESGRIWLPLNDKACDGFIERAAMWPKTKKDDELDSFELMVSEFDSGANYSGKTIQLKSQRVPLKLA